MDWFLYNIGLRHERVKYINKETSEHRDIIMIISVEGGSNQRRKNTQIPVVILWEK